MKAKPHVSPALSRLRGWVTLMATVVVLCAGVKLIVFGFIHYTDVRYTTLVPEQPSKASLVVVKPASGGQEGGAAPGSRIDRGRVISEPITATNRVTVDPNLVLSRADTNMQHASAFAVGAGLLAALMLAFLTCLGSLVAAGASVPGIDRTIGACVWSVIMLLFCLPWPDVAGSMPIPGVFSSYQTVVDASADILRRDSGTASLLASHVLIPALVIGCAVGVCISFRAGVEAGVIVTAVSELDKAIGKELTILQERGVSARQPKAVGALYRAIGDEVEPDPADLPARGAMASGLPGHPPAEMARSMRQADPGRPLPRPI